MNSTERFAFHNKIGQQPLSNALFCRVDVVLDILLEVEIGVNIQVENRYNILDIHAQQVAHLSDDIVEE